MASFSSSLKGSFVVQGFRVAGWLRGLRDGAKSTTRPRRGQAPQAAQPEGRPVDITTESTESRFCGLRHAKRKEAVSVESVGRRFCRKAGKGGASPAGRRVDITTESTESTELRFGGRRHAKRKEAVSVESVARSSRSKGRGRGRLPRRAAG